MSVIGDVTFTVIGDRAMLDRVERMIRADDAIYRTVERLSLDLLRHVKADKLSGQVLKRRTGTLSRRTTSKMRRTKDGYEGIVGTNVPYAAYHEFGFRGNEQVRPHQRTVSVVYGKTLKAPVTSWVRGHTRKVDYAPRSFLRSALKDHESKIQAALTKTLADLARGS